MEQSSPVLVYVCIVYILYIFYFATTYTCILYTYTQTSHMIIVYYCMYYT